MRAQCQSTGMCAYAAHASHQQTLSRPGHNTAVRHMQQLQSNTAACMVFCQHSACRKSSHHITQHAVSALPAHCHHVTHFYNHKTAPSQGARLTHVPPHITPSLQATVETFPPALSAHNLQSSLKLQASIAYCLSNPTCSYLQVVLTENLQVSPTNHCKSYSPNTKWSGSQPSFNTCWTPSDASLQLSLLTTLHPPFHRTSPSCTTRWSG